MASSARHPNVHQSAWVAVSKRTGQPLASSPGGEPALTRLRQWASDRGEPVLFVTLDALRVPPGGLQ